MLLSDLDVQRFQRKTYRDEQGVLRWSGGMSGGYGTFSVNGKHRMAHHIAWVIANGPIPDGMTVLIDSDKPRDVVDLRYLSIGTRKLSDCDSTVIADAVISDPRSYAAISEAFGISRAEVRKIRSGAYSQDCDAYTDKEVLALLENYIEIKGRLLPIGSLRNDTEYVTTALREQSGDGLYRKSYHAHAKGAQNQRQHIEDLYCATLDLEEAMQCLNDKEYAILMYCCILQTHTNEEAAALFGYSGAASMPPTIRNIAMKLRKRMNDGGDKTV